MKKQRVTSRDVALRAGVSQTTVSFVLNNKQDGNISEETTRRVWQAARELGYVPDSMARSLARGSSSNIGLVLVNPYRQVFIDDFVPNVIAGVAEVVQRKRYRILLETVDDPDRLGDAVRNLAYGREVAGLMIVAYRRRPTDLASLHQLYSEGFPVVTLMQVPELPHVWVDHLAGVEQGVAHLIHLGHSDIACISYAPVNPITGTTHRIEAFKAALQAHHLPIHPEWIEAGRFDPETGYAAAQRLLTQATRPTAIMCLNDTMAIGALRAIQNAGLRVPQDIAVVGYDNIRMARYTCPPLTTISAPEVELGQQASNMLLALISQPHDELEPVKLETQLIVRASCGANPDYLFGSE